MCRNLSRFRGKLSLTLYQTLDTGAQWDVDQWHVLGVSRYDTTGLSLRILGQCNHLNPFSFFVTAVLFKTCKSIRESPNCKD